MRLAAFNIENLFRRARVFNADEPDAHGDVLDAHAELNTLFERAVYSEADKARMLELMTALGMLWRDEGRFTRIRKIRGQLITRPRSGGRDPRIVAEGRDDWIGWVELRTEAVDEVAIMNTARVIADTGADVLAIVEAESRPALLSFQELLLGKLGLADRYEQIMLIDGNDRRGIDVGIATRAGHALGLMRSHVDATMPDGSFVFDRDCPEYAVTCPSGAQIMVLPNHFKSKFGGNAPPARAKRRAQAEAVAGYYRRLIDAGECYIAVVGDLNDTPDSPELAPLLQDTNLRDVSDHPAFTAFEFNVSNGHRGIGTYDLGNDGHKIDYLLLSPALYRRVTLGGLFRKGAWPGSRPPRWEVYPELTAKHHAASDHHLIWADIDI